MGKNILTERHTSFSVLNDLLDICQPLFKRTFIENFWHGIFKYNSNECSFLTTTPRLNKIVFDNDLLAQGEELKPGIHYVALSEHSKARLEINKAFNLNNLLEIVVEEGDGVKVYGFSTSLNDPGTVNAFFNHLEIFKQFVCEFNERAAPLIQKANNDLVVPLGVQQKKRAPVTPIYRLSHGRAVRLSERELEVLQILYQGWSAKRAAQLLELSPRTVESYIANIKNKLGASSKSELIRFCAQQKIPELIQ